MTLIEVLAGLAILATLVVAILAAKSRMTRQWANAQRKLRAVAAADDLLSNWWLDPGHFPRTSQGAIEGTRPMVWQTSIEPNPPAQRLGAEVVRLKVFAQDHVATDLPLTMVDVVLPQPETHP